MAHNPESITLQVEGMTCNNCALGVSKALKNEGFEGVMVDFASGEALVKPNAEHSVEAALKTINSLGFKAQLPEEGGAPEGRWSRIEKRFYFTLPFSLLLFCHMFFPAESWINNPWLQILVCLPVYAVGVLQFGKSAFASIRSRVPNMDVLIFTGATAAFAYSLTGTLLYFGTEQIHNYLFFETTATIITLVLLGNVLEHRSVKQTTTAIRELAALQPEKAKRIVVILRYEQLEEVDVEQLNVGDHLQVNTGDRIPVDGTVLEGEGTVDASLVTGESEPITIGTGQEVIGGTILLEGNLKMQADRVGGDTLLSRIITLVKEARQNQPEIQKLGDRVSAVFVPVVLGIAATTFLLAHFAFDLPLANALMNAVAVLVISCPCAMGLATPTAVMVGIGRAAKSGILIRGGDTLEKLASIKTYLFDKTGTLTSGAFQVKHLSLYNGLTEQEAKNHILGLEQHSSHPLAQSIVRQWQHASVAEPMLQVQEHKGMGLHGEDNEGTKWSVGNRRLLAPETAAPNHSFYLLRNGELVAGLDMEDQVQAGAAETISFLQSNDLRTVLVSGDRQEKCESVAKEVGIKEIFSEQLPEDKLQIIATESDQNPTAMVGDGVNDAPALARATVGISFGNATPVALQSAQVVLLDGNDLKQLAEAHLIGKHTLLTIKQNLFWAFFYNIIAIPVAALGWLHPMVAALAMAFSDVMVIGNSIRLKYKKLG